ncbi:hypothetical protein SAY86_000153 [Trapa natans]|uniref:LysM domain-containing protein n=1 Tax=Trapa natans TaxID=22666 RepID=A0AAN7RGD6_TRANT|nr:hypothetical protein SAY86_000153 [Trapa natans]
MEVAQNGSPRTLFLPHPPFLPCPSRPLRFPLNSWLKDRKSVEKRLRNLAGIWGFHVREMLRVRDLSRGALVHVVKEGETLSSISKKYGVSIHAIATVNRDIVDVDLVYEGQHLWIPSLHGWTEKTGRSSLVNFNLNQLQIHKRALDVVKGLTSEQKNFNMLIFQRLPYARTTAYFLVVVPYIAFCIRCMISIFCAKLVGSSTMHHKDAHGPEQPEHGSSRGMRWKYALFEPNEAGTIDAEPETESSAQDGQTEVHHEDASGRYRKLEVDYLKFLSECGITDCGYWRGGLPE